MPLDKSSIGRTYPPSPPFEVGREVIRRFAEAIGDEAAVYTDVEAAKDLGYTDVLAPPTFPFVVVHRAVQQVMDYAEIGFPTDFVIHGDQRFVYTRPIQAGDRLSVALEITSARALRGNNVLGVRGEIADADGEHVVSTFMTLVSRDAEGVGTRAVADQL